MDVHLEPWGLDLGRRPRDQTRIESHDGWINYSIGIKSLHLEIQGQMKVKYVG